MSLSGLIKNEYILTTLNNHKKNKILIRVIAVLAIIILIAAAGYAGYSFARSSNHKPLSSSIDSKTNTPSKLQVPAESIKPSTPSSATSQPIESAPNCTQVNGFAAGIFKGIINTAYFISSQALSKYQSKLIPIDELNNEIDSANNTLNRGYEEYRAYVSNQGCTPAIPRPSPIEHLVLPQ